MVAKGSTVLDDKLDTGLPHPIHTLSMAQELMDLTLCLPLVNMLQSYFNIIIIHH